MMRLNTPVFLWFFIILISLAPQAIPETFLYTPGTGIAGLPGDWEINSRTGINYKNGKFKDTGDRGICAVIYNNDEALLWSNYKIRTFCGITGFYDGSSYGNAWIDVMAGTRNKKNSYGIRISIDNNRIALSLFKHANNDKELILNTTFKTLKPGSDFTFTLEIRISVNKKGVKLTGLLWLPGDNPDKDPPLLTVTDLDLFSQPYGSVAPFTHGTIGIRSQSFTAQAYWKDLTVSGKKNPGSVVIIAPDGFPVVNGRRRTLFGTFRFDGPENEWEEKIIRLSKMGFNFIHSYQFEVRYSEDLDGYIEDAKAFLSLAARYNMGVFLGFPRSFTAGKQKDINKIMHIVSELKTEPALWVWYLYDEPADKFNQDLREAYKELKKLDPFHPVIVTHGKIDKLRQAATFSDVLMPDRYDLPYYFIHIRNLAKDIKYQLSKPYWIASQAHSVNYTHLAREWLYNTSQGSQSLIFGQNTHRPNPKEIRVQYHHAVSLHSPGAIYYWYPDSHYKLEEEAPEVWQALSDLGAEVSELSPVISSEDPVPEVQMYFNGRPKSYLDLSVQKQDTNSHLRIDVNVAPWRKYAASREFNIRYWVRMYEKRLYIGVVNASYTPLFLITLHLPFMYKRVYQLPGHRLIIDRSNTRYQVTGMNKGDVIIRNNNILSGQEKVGINKSLSFFLDECSTAVWCFEPE